MIDGPHRSLPLGKHWKEFMFHVDREACSLEERCQSLSVALKNEFSNPLLSAVRDVLDETKRELFSVVNPVERIKAMRKDYPGSAADDTFFGCVVCELLKGSTGGTVLKDSLKRASQQVAYTYLRSIEEHFCREEKNIEIIDVLRERMDETVQKTDFDSIASKRMENLESGKNVQRISKRVGIDEGPEL